MENSINIVGVQTLDAPEDRILLYLEVIFNNQKYDWIFFCKTSMLECLTEENKQKIYADILVKEEKWKTLKNQTITYQNFDGTTTKVPYQKSEVVKPDNPDYYAIRRNLYPSIQEQLDALWKGPDSLDFQNMLKTIQQIKENNPKP